MTSLADALKVQSQLTEADLIPFEELVIREACKDNALYLRSLASDREEMFKDPILEKEWWRMFGELVKWAENVSEGKSENWNQVVAKRYPNGCFREKAGKS
jgi:hypothetical protein